MFLQLRLVSCEHSKMFEIHKMTTQCEIPRTFEIQPQDPTLSRKTSESQTAWRPSQTMSLSSVWPRVQQSRLFCGRKNESKHQKKSSCSFSLYFSLRSSLMRFMNSFSSCSTASFSSTYLQATSARCHEPMSMISATPFIRAQTNRELKNLLVWPHKHTQARHTWTESKKDPVVTTEKKKL